ncbi:MAG: helix-turn-helix domain-containing protein [Ruminococcaceae bacterium]|nr:helix-turn-helix domain-containing protein [Oscillospiraceae bacterium]
MSNACNMTIELPKKQYQGLIPVSSGEERCAPNHYWGAGVRDTYLIHYVISGKGIFYCGTGKYTVRRGQAFVIFPGTIVKYQADSKDPWHYAWVSFNGDETKEIFAQAKITLQSPVLNLSDAESVIGILKDMPSERSADMANNLKFCARLYEFLSLLLSSNKIEKSTENAYLTTARRYIKAHYSEDITVEQVASHIGISRKYLFAIFKKSLGISPKEYIIECRLKRAKEFLSDRELSVANIAYSVGYKDPLNFSKMFKLKTGSSPSEYRENML